MDGTPPQIRYALSGINSLFPSARVRLQAGDAPTETLNRVYAMPAKAVPKRLKRFMHGGWRFLAGRILGSGRLAVRSVLTDAVAVKGGVSLVSSGTSRAHSWSVAFKKLCRLAACDYIGGVSWIRCS